MHFADVPQSCIRLWSASELPQTNDVSFLNLAPLLHVQSVRKASALPFPCAYLQPVGDIIVDLVDEGDSIVEDDYGLVGAQFGLSQYVS